MSVYSDIIEGIVSWTNRPELVADMNFNIRQAIRSGHRAAKFARDIVVADFTGLDTDQIQYISINDTKLAGFQQVATLGPTGSDLQYTGVDISDLLDVDGYPRDNIFYLVGSQINIRAATPVAELTVRYLKQPVLPTDLEDLDDWIAVNHADYVILWAAATILGVSGEQEIKQRCEGYAKLARDELIAANLELVRR